MREVADLKRLFRKRWGEGWTDTVEPALGGSVGFPDVMVLMRQRGLMHLLPVELKIGSKRNGRVHPVLVRPAQVRWHYHLNEQGGRSALVIGVSEEEAYLVDGREVVNWKVGFPVNKVACRIFFEMETAITVRDMFEEFFRSRMK